MHCRTWPPATGAGAASVLPSQQWSVHDVIKACMFVTSVMLWRGVVPSLTRLVTRHGATHALVRQCSRGGTKACCIAAPGMKAKHPQRCSYRTDGCALAPSLLSGSCCNSKVAGCGQAANAGMPACTPAISCAILSKSGWPGGSPKTLNDSSRLIGSGFELVSSAASSCLPAGPGVRGRPHPLRPLCRRCHQNPTTSR